MDVILTVELPQRITMQSTQAFLRNYFDHHFHHLDRMYTFGTFKMGWSQLFTPY